MHYFALPSALTDPATASGLSGKERDVTRFQLVFHDLDLDRVETHDNNDDGEPRLLGIALLDGMIFARHGTTWLATRDDIVDAHGESTMRRFICTPAPDVVGEREIA